MDLIVDRVAIKIQSRIGNPLTDLGFLKAINQEGATLACRFAALLSIVAAFIWLARWPQTPVRRLPRTSQIPPAKPVA